MHSSPTTGIRKEAASDTPSGLYLSGLFLESSRVSTIVEYDALDKSLPKTSISHCVEVFHSTWVARLSFLCVYSVHVCTRATKVGGGNVRLMDPISKFRVHIEKLCFCRVIRSRVAVLYGKLWRMREPRRQSAPELP